MTQPQSRLGRIGVWSLELRFGDHAEAAKAAAELDELGYSTLWVPGGVGGDITGDLDRLLGATQRANVATGILNIWKHEPAEIAGWWKDLSSEKQNRVILGLGVSHAHVIGDAYAKPLQAMRDYLARLDAEGLPKNARCLAALGPKMLGLAREQSAGVHPYLVTPHHTAHARAALGDKGFVAPEVGVILETNPAKARALGRTALSHYHTYPNYQASWRRLGFSDEEISTISDRLVDALFAWGDEDRIAAKIGEHLDAGADHVCIQAITGAGLDFARAREVWKSLAEALL